MNEEMVKKNRRQEKSAIRMFRKRTDSFFIKINSKSATELENEVKAKIQDIINDNDIDVKINEVILCGSRSRGVENDNSDIDFILTYTGTVDEETLYNIIAGEDLKIDGSDIKVDVSTFYVDYLIERANGTVKLYLQEMERYLLSKRLKIYTVIFIPKERIVSEFEVNGKMFSRILIPGGISFVQPTESLRAAPYNENRYILDARKNTYVRIQCNTGRVIGKTEQDEPIYETLIDKVSYNELKQLCEDDEDGTKANVIINRLKKKNYDMSKPYEEEVDIGMVEILFRIMKTNDISCSQACSMCGFSNAKKNRYIEILRKTKFCLVKKSVEIKWKDRFNIREGCTMVCDDECGSELLMLFIGKEEALDELRECQTSIRKLSGSTGEYFLIEEYYVKEFDFDEDEEVIKVGDILEFSKISIEVVSKPDYETIDIVNNYKKAEELLDEYISDGNEAFISY